jgi:TolB-like protein
MFECDRLSGLPNLRVISRTSAFHYKGKDIDPQKVAKEDRDSDARQAPVPDPK